MPSLPATAQEIAFDIAPTEDCTRQGGPDADLSLCIGAAAMACAAPYGFSTKVEGFCNDQEFLYWEARLAAARQALHESNLAEDAAAAAQGLPMPTLAPALADMMATWEAARDAECGYVMAQYRGGTGQGPALAYCLMWKTGQMALNLEGWLASAALE